MVEITDIFLGIAVGLGSLNAILNVIVIRNFPVVRDIRHILKQLGGGIGTRKHRTKHNPYYYSNPATEKYSS